MRSALLLVAFVVSACAADPVPLTACTAGVSTACTCSSGATGAQVCAANGSGYGACVCTGSDAGADVVVVGDAGPDALQLDAAGDTAGDSGGDGGADVIRPDQDGRCPPLLYLCRNRCIWFNELDNCGACGISCGTPAEAMCVPEGMSGRCVQLSADAGTND